MKKILLILALLALTGAGPGFEQVQSTDVDQLIATQGPTLWLDPDSPTEIEPLIHYKLEDNAASTAVVDSSGNYAGTASANTSTFCNASAKVSKGCDFYTGSAEQKIDAGAVAGLGVSTNISLCVWLYPHGAGGAGYGRLVDAEHSSINWDGANTINMFGAKTTNGFAYNAWHHFCGVRQIGATNGGQLYLDGASAYASGSINAASDLSSHNLYIGGRAADAVVYFDGIMDDLRIYNRALTPNEVERIYNNGTGHQNQATSNTQGAIVIDSSNRIGAWQSTVGGIEFVNSTDADKPIFSKLNSRRVLSLDGTDNLTSTSALSTIFADGAKTIFAVGQATTIDADTTLFVDSSTKFALKTFTTGSGVWRAANDDGAADGVEIAGANATPVVLFSSHDGNFLRLRSNAVEGTGVASGNTDALTGTLQIGISGATFFTGLSGPIIAFNKVLPKPVIETIEKGLAQKYGISFASITPETDCDAYIASLTPTLWLEGNDLSTITKDGSNQVSSWASRIGSITMTQATDENKPVWVTTGVDYLGVHDSLTSTATTGDIFTNAAKTHFFVANCDSFSAGFEDVYLCDSDSYIRTDIVAGPKLRFMNFDGSEDVATCGALSTGVNFIFEVTHDTGNIQCWINGGNTDGAVASGNTSNTTKAIRFGVTTNSPDCRFMTVLTDDSVWTVDQRARVRSCLGQKYGISF